MSAQDPFGMPPDPSQDPTQQPQTPAPPQPSGFNGRKVLNQALQNFVFSMAQGAAAQAAAPPGQRNRAGMAGAFSGPMQLQMIQQKQQQDALDRQIKIAQFRRQLQEGQQSDEDRRANIMMTMAKTPIMAPEQQVPPAAQSTNLPDWQGPTQTQVQPVPDLKFTLAGKQFSIPQATIQGIRDAKTAEERTKLIEEAQNKANEPYTLAEGAVRNVGGETIATNPKPAEPPKSTTYQPQTISVDGRGPIEALRDPQGNFIDATTRTPIKGKIGTYVAPREGPQPALAVIDDPASPGKQMLVSVDRGGGTASPVTIGGQTAGKTPAAQQNAVAAEKKAADEMAQSLTALEKLAKQGTYAADQAMADQFFNIIKPGSGARMNEASIQRLLTPGPLADKMTVWAQKLSKGQPLDTSARQDILSAARAVVEAKQGPAGAASAKPTIKFTDLPK